MHPRKPPVGSILAALALFAAFGGSAAAADHYLISTTKQIKPSVLRSLRGKTGPRGPQGAQGTAGVSGAPGAQGPPGPSNLSGLNITNGESKSIPPETVGSATATCPPGAHVLSGGGYTGLANLADSQMSADHQSWILVVDNETIISTHLEAIAYCAGAGQAVAASADHRARARLEAEAHQLLERILAERAATQH